MTSQIAVFNLECVAVASDSVLTVGDGKKERTLATSEKVFDLGPAHQLVALGSGEARFMRVPWSVLIREWSSGLATPFAHVSDYAANLVAWLEARTDLFTAEEQTRYFTWQVRDYFLSVRLQILRELEERELTGASWDDLDVQSCVNEIIRANVNRLRELSDLEGTDLARESFAVQTETELIAEVLKDVFDDVPRTVEGDEMLMLHIPALILAKHEDFSFDSTIALVGYGSDDLFPGHQVIEFHGMVHDRVRCLWWEPMAVSQGRSSLITPFAQIDAINTFVRAYHADFLNQAHRTLDAVLDEHLGEETSADGVDADAEVGEDDGEPVLSAREQAHLRLNDDFDGLSWERFVSPMLSTVDALPRADMARMAEALVGVQALRAASLGGQPTVGGPIDVAVIDRANGVQWLRRKELTLN